MIPGYALLLETRSTIEVAHSRYFVSERRGSLTRNRRNINLDFEKKRFVDSGHGIIETALHCCWRKQNQGAHHTHETRTLRLCLRFFLPSADYTLTYFFR